MPAVCDVCSRICRARLYQLEADGGTLAGSLWVPHGYVLYRSYVLLARRPIEPISHPIRAWVPLRKAQRIEEVTYESPALPLSYSAVVFKRTERAGPGQPSAFQHITIEQHITFCRPCLSARKAHARPTRSRCETLVVEV
jgi:hypothetical protein